jgi:hypothetical protein
VVPRVGEYVHGLGNASVWYGPAGRTGGPYSAVAAVEHAPVPAFKADPADAEKQPTVTVVVRALWPGDGPLAGERVLRDYDEQGWKLHFFSDNSPTALVAGHGLRGRVHLLPMARLTGCPLVLLCAQHLPLKTAAARAF